MTDDKKFLKFQVAKVDAELGIIFGWGIICTEKGQPYFDLQDEHIPEGTMLKAVTDFMLNSRKADQMHDENVIGEVVHSMPLTADVAKAFRIQCPKSGWMLVVKPDDASFQKFKDGTYTGFSIGGYEIRSSEVTA